MTTTMGTDRIVTVAGRRVAVAELGDPAGTPLFLVHGTPASRLGHGFADGPARARGIRVLCPDRGGIGASDPVPGRTVAGYAAEVLALADALGVGDFGVLGYSGGGPYALACAAGCGPRLVAVGTMAGLGPLDRPGAAAGLAESDLRLLRLARDAPRRAAVQLRVLSLLARLAPGTVVRQFAAELGPVDRAALAAVPAREVCAFLVEALRPGPGGVLVDYRLLGEPWRIDWTAVRVPVHVFQGDADAMVPMHHAEDIVRRLPDGLGLLHRLAGVGHVSIQARVGDVLDVLLPGR